MPEAVPAWKTTDDKTHTSYLAALKHELMMWLAQIGDNDVGAKRIVEALTADTIDEIVEQFTAIQTELKEPARFTVEKTPFSKDA